MLPLAPPPALTHLAPYAGRRATVVVFVGADCPIVRLQLPKLQALSRAWASKGVAVVAVDANAGESAAQMTRAAAEHGATFPVVMDPKQRLADRLGATRTPEAVLLDAQGAVRYRGEIDDQYGLTSRRAAPTRTPLVRAVESVLSGRAVAVSRVAASGCPIDRLGAPEPDKVTWARDVAPILQSRCESCHRPGQIAPFSLVSYADARRWAKAIGESTQAQRMPPWHADPAVGHFSNDRSLTTAQRATLKTWVDQGAPQGDPKQAPRPRAWSDTWAIGKPDAVLTMEESFKVAATGVLPYQLFRIKTGFTQDRWIQAAEVRPGVRSVVHHVLVFVDDHSGKPMSPIDGQLISFVPGDVSAIFPKGMARKVPAGADLLLQVHYTPVGKEALDRTSVGLVFASEPPAAVVDTLAIFQPLFAIPAGADDFPVDRWFTASADAKILSLWPHMHLRGRSMEITAHYPDGTTETLLRVPKYDFNWQTRYVLSEPKRIPKGTRIHVRATFDNSKGNPANPDPTRIVHWGEQTDSEMMVGYLDYVLDDNAAAATFRRHPGMVLEK